MSENKKQVRKVRVKKRSEYRLGFNWFFWTCCVLIAIPCIYFLGLLYQSSIESHTPVIGNRLTNSIVNEINETNLEQISSKINALADVESAVVDLKVATVRITVDAKDNLTVEEYTQLIEDIYAELTTVLPEEKYFSLIDDYKQYDAEINLYDSLEKEEPIIVNLTKVASNESKTVQVLSDARDAELKEELLHQNDEVEE